MFVFVVIVDVDDDEKKKNPVINNNTQKWQEPTIQFMNQEGAPPSHSVSDVINSNNKKLIILTHALLCVLVQLRST